MLTRELMHVSEGPPLRRFRRRFTTVEKATIVEESYKDGNSDFGVARRYGLTPQQLSGSRRLARLGLSRSAQPASFVRVVVAPEAEVPINDERSLSLRPHKRRRRSKKASIELQIGGVVVRVSRDADAGAIAAVIGAVWD